MSVSKTKFVAERLRCHKERKSALPATSCTKAGRKCCCYSLAKQHLKSPNLRRATSIVASAKEAFGPRSATTSTAMRNTPLRNNTTPRRHSLPSFLATNCRNFSEVVRGTTNFASASPRCREAICIEKLYIALLGESGSERCCWSLRAIVGRSVKSLQVEAGVPERKLHQQGATYLALGVSKKKGLDAAFCKQGRGHGNEPNSTLAH